MGVTMKIYRSITLVVALAALGGLVACGDGVNDSKKMFVVANNFSDANWKNGVLQKDGRSNIFYSLHRETDSFKVKAGDTLRFAKTGGAVVQKIESSAPNING